MEAVGDGLRMADDHAEVPDGQQPPSVQGRARDCRDQGPQQLRAPLAYPIAHLLHSRQTQQLKFDFPFFLRLYQSKMDQPETS